MIPSHGSCCARCEGWDMSLRIPKNTRTRAGRGASLALLLTAWYTSASFVVVAVATGLLYLALSDNLRKISEQSLLDEVEVCRALVLEQGGDSSQIVRQCEIG